MRRPLIALFALALLSADAQAGPIRNLIGRFQERRAARQVQAPAPASASCSTCPVSRPGQVVPPTDCPDGRCPLRRVSAVAAAEPFVEVYEFPRRMP